VKLGKLELQVLLWLDNRYRESITSTSIPLVMGKFARFTRKAGARSGSFNYAQISKILDKLTEKGFIEIRNRGRADAEIILIRQVE
jgi:hypothetical protein